MLIERNEGRTDRLIRIVGGLVLLSLTVVGPRTTWGLLGLIPLLTGIVGYCPLYRIAGTNSCRRA